MNVTVGTQRAGLKENQNEHDGKHEPLWTHKTVCHERIPRTGTPTGSLITRSTYVLQTGVASIGREMCCGWASIAARCGPHKRNPTACSRERRSSPRWTNRYRSAGEDTGRMEVPKDLTSYVRVLKLASIPRSSRRSRSSPVRVSCSLGSLGSLFSSL